MVKISVLPKEKREARRRSLIHSPRRNGTRYVFNLLSRDLQFYNRLFQIKAPSVFKNRNIGQTLVTRSAGTKLAADGLRGRVYEVNQADLHGDESTYRKFR